MNIVPYCAIFYAAIPVHFPQPCSDCLTVLYQVAPLQNEADLRKAWPQSRRALMIWLHPLLQKNERYKLVRQIPNILHDYFANLWISFPPQQEPCFMLDWICLQSAYLFICRILHSTAWIVITGLHPAFSTYHQYLLTSCTLASVLCPLFFSSPLHNLSSLEIKAAKVLTPNRQQKFHL